MANDPAIQHEIIADIKRIAIELGRIPTRDDYLGNGGIFSGRKIEMSFGGWTVALNAAGLSAAKRDKRAKVSNEDIFGRDLVEQLAGHQSQIATPDAPKPMKSTAVVGDLHFPFTNMQTLEKFYAFLAKEKPARCVQMGDLLDQMSHSKFPTSRNIYTPAQEMSIGHKMSKEFWARVQEIVPGIECHQILGNHDVRPIKRLIESYPAGELFFSIDRFYQFDGVTTHLDARKELILDGVIFHHGYRSKLGDHRDYALMSCVVGHTHTGGVTFRQVRGEILFELNAGFMGDVDSKALSYTSQKIVQWTQGFGYIDQYGPRFIPCP
jgi:predicted phosphodiesterase